MDLKNVVAISCRTNTGEMFEVPVREFFGLYPSQNSLGIGVVPKSDGKAFIASDVTEGANGQLTFKNYKSETSFTGIPVGILAFDANGRVVTVPFQQNQTSPKTTTQESPSSSVQSTINKLPIWTDNNGGLGDSDIIRDGESYSVGGTMPFWKWDVYQGSVNIAQSSISDGFRLNGKLVVSYDPDSEELTIGNAVYTTTNLKFIKTDSISWNASGGGSITDVATATTGNYTLTKPAKDGTYALLSDITDTAWLLNGNALTEAKSIGSTTNYDVSVIRHSVTKATFGATTTDFDAAVYNFKNGGATYATLNSTGLGIGTSSPSQKLTVSGSILSDNNIIANNAFSLSALNGSILLRNNTYATSTIELHIRPNQGNKGYITFTENAVDDRWAIGIEPSNSSLHFKTTPTSDAKLLITSSGNVGIGTTSPSVKTEIAGNNSGYWNGSSWTTTPLALAITNYLSGGYDPVLLFKQADSGGTVKDAGGIGLVGTSGWTAGINGVQTSDMYFVVRNNSGSVSERMRITSSGNVGIGTTSPSELLHVNGTSRTTNLKITNGATVGYVWQCNNADGTGAWTTPLTSERYIGEWAANSGVAPSGSPTTGDYWVVNTAGTYSGTTYAAGDEIYWNGSTWLKRSNYLTLPTATSSILGGIKIGSNLAIDGSGVVTVTSSPILTTARTIALSGDATWSVSFNGSADVTSALTLATVNSNIGTFRSVTVNAKGLVTAATNPSIVLTTDVSGILPIANGGTGSSTQNFVDLTTDQAVDGVKEFYDEIKVKSNQVHLTSDFLNRGGSVASYGVLSNKLGAGGLILDVKSTGGLYFRADTTRKGLFDTNGLILSSSLGNSDVPTERLDVRGNIRYNTLLKPNNIAGTNGQFLGTNGTQDVWTTLTTSHISNLSSYTGFTNYFTETEIIAGYQPLDDTLTSLAALTVSTGILVQTTGDSQFVLRSITGTTDRVSVSNGNGGAGNPTIDIASTYVGQTSITTLGTVSMGTWNGTTIGYAYGGTGLTALGTAGQLLKVNSGATALEYFTPTYISANQTITLSGIITGSGTTAITTSIADNTLSIAKTSGLQTSLDGKQSTLPSGTAGQFLIRNASAELEFFNLELEPTRLTSNKIAVGDSANYLSDYNNFEFLESRFVSILKVDDSTKSVAWGMYGASSNSFISASGGSLTVRGDNGLIFSNFAGGGTLALTVDNDGKVGVTPLGTGGGSTPTLASTYIGYGSSGNALTGTSNFVYDAIKTAVYFNDSANYLYVGKSVSVSDMFEITAVGARGIQLNTDMDIVIKNNNHLYLGSGASNKRVHIGRGASYNDANHYLVINGETFSFSMDNISGWGDTNSETTPQVGDKVLFNVVDVAGNKRFVPQKINKKLASALSGSETVLIL